MLAPPARFWVSVARCVLTQCHGHAAHCQECVRRACSGGAPDRESSASGAQLPYIAGKLSLRTSSPTRCVRKDGQRDAGGTSACEVCQCDGAAAT
jgi:hypothetical protein